MQRLAILVLGMMLAWPAFAQQPGWHYSPLPGEGDRAAMGCDRDASPQVFTCLAVRCEDDYSVGVYVHTTRAVGSGAWEMTIDRENATLVAEPSAGPYGGRFVERGDWLRERIEQGTFVYLRPAGEASGAFAYIGLGGSLVAITNALAYCTPRVQAKAS